MRRVLWHIVFCSIDMITNVTDAVLPGFEPNDDPELDEVADALLSLDPTGRRWADDSRPVGGHTGRRRGMKRRLVLAGGALGAAAWLVDRHWLFPGPAPIETTVRHPGRDAGHRFRDHPLTGGARYRDAPVLREAEVAIVGSGVAGLSCAWALQRAGLQDFVLIDGPAPHGNAAHGMHRFSPYPQGAHYLPVPSRECMHVRKILADLGVLVDGIDDDAPAYDERCLVHASVDRVLHGGQWHAGLLPPLPRGSAAEAQWALVQAAFERLRRERDATTGVPVGNTVALKVVPAQGSPVSAVSSALAGTSDTATASVQVNIAAGPSVLQASTTYNIVVAQGEALSKYAQGERVEKVRLETALGGAPTVTLITVSGREFTLPAASVAGFGG